jgi:hypothetical protein
MGKYCLAIVPPIRVPFPPATRIAALFICFKKLPELKNEKFSVGKKKSPEIGAFNS